jgi:hypothetical protein
LPRSGRKDELPDEGQIAIGFGEREDAMKVRACIRMLLAVGVVLAAASVAGAGKKQQPSRPFWGNSAGEIHQEFGAECPGGFFSVADVEGEMTHLGRTMFSSRHCIGLPFQDMRGGTAVFTAANGDKLFVSAGAGTFEITKYTPQLIVEEGVYTITGGTGRFQDASGSLNVTCFVAPGGQPPPGPWRVEIVFAGTISY